MRWLGQKKAQAPVEELERIRSRGRRAQKFLDDEFWKNDLEPVMLKELSDVEKPVEWAPGSGKTVDEIALSSVYLSGAKAGLKRFRTRVVEMVELGKAAEAELNRMEKNK